MERCRVVDEAIDAFAPFEGLAHDSCPLVGPGHIVGHVVGSFAKSRGDLFPLLVQNIPDHDGRAVLDEAPGGGRSRASGRSSNNGQMAFEIFHPNLLPKYSSFF
jgi:hypothetical protein